MIYEAIDRWNMTQPYLMHYGVKGMKWGIRKRREVSNNVPKKRSIAKKVAIGVGITVASAAIVAGAYFAKKYYDMNADVAIKAGKSIQHMGNRPDNSFLNEPFYASYLKSDNKVYAKNDLFGKKWLYKKTMKSKSDIKVAGSKTAVKMYGKWQKETNGNEYKSKSDLKSSYLKFNRNMNTIDMRDKKQYNSFYNYLSKNGYDAIRDMNDQWLSGTRSPIIIFNKLKDIKVTKIEKIK